MQPNDIFNDQKNLLDQFDDINSFEEHSHIFLLTFDINMSKFAIEFNHIQEVLEHFKPTPYPFEVDGHVGVINLRGNVIPIINPFEEEVSSLNSDSTKIIILDSKDKHSVGIVVENVKKVNVDKEFIDEVVAEKVISVDNQPVRYVLVESLLSGFLEEK